MSNSIEDGTADEGAAEQALRDGFKASVLSADAMRRIRQTTEQEWREVSRVPVRRRSPLFAVAASIVGIIGAASWAWFAKAPGSAEGAVLGQLATLNAPGLFEVNRFTPDSALVAGASLRAGQRLDARGDAVVTMSDGGNLRIARASALEVRGSDAVSISRGEIYVDIPPGSHASSSFRVLTSAGEFRHVGTQFAILIAEGQTRLRVREGQVIWRAASGESTVDAGTEVIIDKKGAASRRTIPTAGRDWAWTDAMAPDVIIDNRPLLEFLQWFARETGRKLEIDAQSRQQASTILMHGSVKGLTVTEALSAVMATSTALNYQLREGVIRVSSQRVSQAGQL